MGGYGRCSRETLALDDLLSYSLRCACNCCTGGCFSVAGFGWVHRFHLEQWGWIGGHQVMKVGNSSLSICSTWNIVLGFALTSRLFWLRCCPVI